MVRRSTDAGTPSAVTEVAPTDERDRGGPQRLESLRQEMSSLGIELNQDRFLTLLVSVGARGCARVVERGERLSAHAVLSLGWSGL